MNLVTVIARALLAAALLAWISVPPSHGQSGAGGSPAKVVVGTMRIPPFVLRGDDGKWGGLSVELWQQIAAELKVDFEFREFDFDLPGLLDAVERRQVDVAVAAIPVTLEGEARFDFSHPYFAAGLGIAVRMEQPRGVFGTLAGLVTPQLLATIAGLFGVLLCVGTLVWLVERRANARHFDPRPVQGIGDGLWWAAVTMTTTGYGDKVPASWGGRLLGLVWMFASIFLIALFSGAPGKLARSSRWKTGTGKEAAFRLVASVARVRR